jgi:hypothetical protein
MVIEGVHDGSIKAVCIGGPHDGQVHTGPAGAVGIVLGRFEPAIPTHPTVDCCAGLYHRDYYQAKCASSVDPENNVAHYRMFWLHSGTTMEDAAPIAARLMEQPAPKPEKQRVAA